MLGNVADWSLDREIVLSRVLDAPRELVFKAWTDAEHVTKWFGPKGYTTETQEIDVRVGGRWRFVMTGPDGKRWDNRIVYLEIASPERIVFDHGRDLDDDATRFRVTLTFDQQSDGKTVVTLRQLHPTKAQRDAGIGFGAVEIGYTTLDKLGAYVAGLQRPQ
ncbi:MAG: ATPase [Archangium gephyra]|uniref:ATPase n=1 Tax=Archangium gephyra TaxID=48 RepID=A0A2W5UVN2_9BACT|nr:MAG: ATPase [Archangium gephyra]